MRRKFFFQKISIFLRKNLRTEAKFHENLTKHSGVIKKEIAEGERLYILNKFKFHLIV